MTVKKFVGNAQVPQNPKLWEQLVKQARAKFHPFPSLPASRWVHREYVRMGGTFVMSHRQNNRHDPHGNMTGKGKKEQSEHNEDEKKREAGLGREDKDERRGR